MKHLTIGYLGEVGSAVFKVFGGSGIDKNGSNNLTEWLKSDEDSIMHVCIPYGESFTTFVMGYLLTYKPTHTVIHSTVPVGTSRVLNAMHSPIRGLHPNLYEGIMTFEKFIGGEDGSLIADEFRRAGLKVVLVDKQETTELGKLLDTEYYRACIEFAHRTHELCQGHEVPFHEVYTLFNQTYNKGYTKLGHDEFVRPVLQPIMKPISGHCVMSNKFLLEK